MHPDVGQAMVLSGKSILCRMLVDRRSNFSSSPQVVHARPDPATIEILPQPSGNVGSLASQKPDAGSVVRLQKITVTLAPFHEPFLRNPDI
jgi:hypothetical protein